MSGVTGAGPRISWYERLARLHWAAPHDPLPPLREVDREHPLGLPFRPVHPTWRKAAADLVDAHFADHGAEPEALAEAVAGMDLEARLNDHLRVVLHERTDQHEFALHGQDRRIHETGRWLVRYGADSSAVRLGLFLVQETTRFWADLPLDPTVVRVLALDPELTGQALPLFSPEALAEGVRIWVVERTATRAGATVLNAMISGPCPVERPWLLRNAVRRRSVCSFNAGELARNAYLAEAITEPEVDDALVDNTTAILLRMTNPPDPWSASGLEDYPPGRRVLTAHAAHVARQRPTARRFAAVTDLWAALELFERWWPNADLRARYAAVLDLPDWLAAAHDGLVAECGPERARELLATALRATGGSRPG